MVFGTLLLAVVGVGAAQAQGLVLPGSGVFYRTMAGAWTAVATDAAGALYWNPAMISG